MDYEKQARRQAVLSYARNLARSGRYADWEAVQAATKAMHSLPAAGRWFADPGFRAQLDQLCALALKGHTGPRGPRGARLSLALADARARPRSGSGALGAEGEPS